ncbi:MAG TPA: hypothetical protein ENI42_03710 [Thermoplasmatales archaeon]|nr:hypothetical protein [Thermoplasmatales archaeon]
MSEDMSGSENGNLLSMFELGNEISSLVAKGKITSVIGEKIKEKVKERGVSLTREQLYKLVDKINENLRSQPLNTSSSPPTSSTPKPAYDVEENVETKKLFEALESLHKRVETLEKAQTEWMENWSKYMTRSGTTESPENVTAPSVHRDTTGMYPLMSIPSDPESIVVVMKWLQYLVDKVGKSRVPEVLNYYVDVGWITEEAKMKLLEYCEGITGREGGDGGSSELLAKDHIQSFLFIQKLMGSKVDEYFLNRIERDISKLTKNLDSLSLH